MNFIFTAIVEEPIVIAPSPPAIISAAIFDAPYPAAFPAAPVFAEEKPAEIITEQVYVAPPPAPELLELPPVVERKLCLFAWDIFYFNVFDAMNLIFVVFFSNLK